MSKKNSIRHPFYEEVRVPVEETWKDLPEFEGYYQMSTQGRVKSLSRIVPHAKYGTYTVRGKILKQGWDGHYFHVMLYVDTKEYTKLVHRGVLDTFVGPCPEGLWCRHLDGNAKNNRLENLCWDTPQNNQRDKLEHGTDSRDILGNSHKLRYQIGELYEMWKSDEYTTRELAEMFQVTIAAVFYHIRKFKSSGAPKLKER